MIGERERMEGDSGEKTLELAKMEGDSVEEKLDCAKMEGKLTRIMLAVSGSNYKCAHDPSESSRQAFEFTMEKIVRSDASRCKLLILHVIQSDPEGTSDRFFILSLFSITLFFLQFMIITCFERCSVYHIPIIASKNR